MAITNHERVGKAMELLRAGLAPFLGRCDVQHFSILGDRSAGDMNALTCQQTDDGVVGQRRGAILAIDQAFDHGAHSDTCN